MDWSLVQPGVASLTRVCSYDRAGLGWSEAGPAGHTSRENVETLHALLEKAGVPPPYILVGHSLGGLDMQLYAARYPSEVAGMVLVDSSHGRQDVADGMPRIPGIASFLFSLLGSLGGGWCLDLERWLPPALAPKEAWLRQVRASIYAGARHLRAAAAELAALPASLAQARATPWDLAQKPLVVLSHGIAMRLPLLSQAKAERMEAAWEGFQKELASRSRNSCQTMATGSGHFIALEQPALVVEAIGRVIESVRGQRPMVPLGPQV